MNLHPPKKIANDPWCSRFRVPSFGKIPSLAQVANESPKAVHHPGRAIVRRIRTSAPPAVSPERIKCRFVEGLLRTARTLEPHREVDDRTKVESDPPGRTSSLQISLEFVNEGLKPARQNQ
jgi:hypothetical protein